MSAVKEARPPRDKIRILVGSECDILADGTMDSPNEVLGEPDGARALANPNARPLADLPAWVRRSR